MLRPILSRKIFIYAQNSVLGVFEIKGDLFIQLVVWKRHNLGASLLKKYFL